MQEKHSQLIVDISITEKILERIPLQQRRTREALVRRIQKDHLLSDRFGKLFLLTLEKGNSYSTYAMQEQAREDCIRFRALIEVCLYGSKEEWLEWSEKLQNNKLPLTSWVKKPAYFYLKQLAEEREKKLIQQSAEKQQNDIKLMAELSEQTNLETQEEVDRLYDYLCELDHPYFQSWIGRGFVEQLQQRTSRYQKNQKQRRLLLICSGICFALFISFLGILLYHQQIRDREQWKNEVLDEIREDESGTSYEENNLPEENEIVMDEEADEEFAENVGEPSNTPKILAQYKKLHKKNPDLVGWLQVPGIELSLPVMQNLEDESFYLSHNFEGESIRSGALFIDAQTSIENPGKNIVIYGHNMSSGDIFGNLNFYKERAFWEQHQQFQFDTIYEEGMYDIIAVIKTHVRKQKEEGFRYYEFYDYDTEDQFQEFVDFLNENKIYDTDIEPEYGDSFVLLSTCEYSEEEGRLVIIGRKE